MNELLDELEQALREPCAPNDRGRARILLMELKRALAAPDDEGEILSSAAIEAQRRGFERLCLSCLQGFNGAHCPRCALAAPRALEGPPDGSPERIDAIVAALNDAFCPAELGSFADNDSGRLVGALLKRGLEIRALGGVSRTLPEPTPDYKKMLEDLAEAAVGYLNAQAMVGVTNDDLRRLNHRLGSLAGPHLKAYTAVGREGGTA